MTTCVNHVLGAGTLEARFFERTPAFTIYKSELGNDYLKF